MQAREAGKLPVPQVCLRTDRARMKAKGRDRFWREIQAYLAFWDAAGHLPGGQASQASWAAG